MLGELQVVDGDVDVPIRGAKQRTAAAAPAGAGPGDGPGRAPGRRAVGRRPARRRCQRAAGARLQAAARPRSPERRPDHVGRWVPDRGRRRRDRCSVLRGGRRQGSRGARRRRDRPTRPTLLADALALWRGPALDGSDDEGILRGEAIRLEELRWGVLEDRIDADLRSGRDVELVGELEQLVGEAPLRERLHGFLMLALYRAGRQAEALRAYQHARDVLGEELGLDPGPELQALESAILNQDPSLLLCPEAQSGNPRPADQHHRRAQPLHRTGGRPRGARRAGRRPPTGHDRRTRGRRQDAARPGAGAPPARAGRVPRGAGARRRPGRGHRRGGGRHRPPRRRGHPA